MVVVVAMALDVNTDTGAAKKKDQRTRDELTTLFYFRSLPTSILHVHGLFLKTTLK